MPSVSRDTQLSNKLNTQYVLSSTCQGLAYIPPHRWKYFDDIPTFLTGTCNAYNHAMASLLPITESLCFLMLC